MLGRLDGPSLCPRATSPALSALPERQPCLQGFTPSCNSQWNSGPSRSSHGGHVWGKRPGGIRGPFGTLPPCGRPFLPGGGIGPPRGPPGGRPRAVAGTPDDWRGGGAASALLLTSAAVVVRSSCGFAQCGVFSLCFAPCGMFNVVSAVWQGQGVCFFFNTLCRAGEGRVKEHGRRTEGTL
jgi:hypothetical protein